MSPRHAAPLTLEHVLLALLDQKPMHGYELYQELCLLPGIDRIWNIKMAMLYAILDKLERGGYVSSRLDPAKSYPPRHYFQLTPAGRGSLQEWLSSPVRRARELRQEFLAKLIIARRYGKTPLLELIEAQERACQAWLHELQAHVPPQDSEHFDEWLVYSFRLNREQGILGWLKDVRAQAERLADADAPADFEPGAP